MSLIKIEVLYHVDDCPPLQMDYAQSLYYDPEAQNWVTEEASLNSPCSHTFAKTEVPHEFFPSEQSTPTASAIMNTHPIGCVVCIAQGYFLSDLGNIRRASYGTMRCRDHRHQCSYCRSPECQDTLLLCERCSYSGAASIVQEILSTPSTKICLYDSPAKSASDGWACGCSHCIQVTTSFYVARSLEEGLGQSIPSSPSSVDSDFAFRLEQILVE